MRVGILALCGAADVLLSACGSDSQALQDAIGDAAIMHYTGEADCRAVQSRGTRGYASCMAALKLREDDAWRHAVGGR